MSNYAIQHVVLDCVIWNVLSVFKKGHLTLWMLDRNAAILLELERISQKLFIFKSSLSREILLVVASGDGVCELRKLFKLMNATPTAIRLHVQSLMDDNYLLLEQHKTNRRCKNVVLTDKAWLLLSDYEQQIQNMMDGWRHAESRRKPHQSR